jgi:hypothetical protein
MTSHSYQRRNAVRMAGWIGAIALMFGAIALEPIVGEPATIGLVSVGAVLALGLCTYAFLRLDELAQRAHYVAWFWGGTLGFAVVALLLLLGLTTGLADMDALHALAANWLGGDSFVHGVSLGMLLLGAPMLVGYAIWWTVFWLRRR